MNLWGWGQKQWKEWNPWGHKSEQQPDQVNGQDYPSTRIEQEGAAVVAMAGGKRSGVTPADKQRMGDNIREAQGIRAQEQWKEQQQREQDNRERQEKETQQRLENENRERERVGKEHEQHAQPTQHPQTAREKLAHIRQQQGIPEQVREERDRARQLELQQGGIER